LKTYIPQTQPKAHSLNKQCFGDAQAHASLASLEQWGICSAVTPDFSTLLPRELSSISAFTSVKEISVVSASLHQRERFWKPQDLEELPPTLSVPAFGRTCRKQLPGNALLCPLYPQT